VTVAEAVEKAAARLAEGPHKERARLDAEALLMHLLEANRAWLITHGDYEIGKESTSRHAELVERRYRGEPIQYITGETEFYGLPFRVTRDVLIPRPETEHLVEQAIALAREFMEPRIVDVGAGSGAIAVALAVHLAGARITTIDVSADALAIARENAARNAVSEQLRFLQGDLLEPVAGEEFDLVVSNPPYVPEADRESLSVEVREYEPAQALFAGRDGLDVYRRLIPAAYAALAPGGYVLLEIGYGQAEGVRALLAGRRFEGIHFLPDLQGIARVACGRRQFAAPVVK
jgi:release factor glutamine methyltransferase